MVRTPFTPIVLAVAVAIVSTGGTSLAQSPRGDIWDAAVMAQPFDTQPFHRIKIPGWVQETIGCGYTLSGMGSEARAAAAKHGVTLSELGFVDPFYAYYDSK